MDHALLRMFAVFNHWMVFASAAIVTGIDSFLLHADSYRGVNIVYQEVTAVITLAFYLAATFLPFIDKYKGHLVPLNLTFSYLWLTSFIFAAQEWSQGRCAYDPPGVGRCSLKKAAEAFDFIAFFFLLCNIVAEGVLWEASSRPSRHSMEKERIDSAATAPITEPNLEAVV